MHRFKHFKSGFLLTAFLDLLLFCLLAPQQPIYLCILPITYLIFWYLRIHRYKKRLCRMQLSQIDRLSGLDFEYYLYYLFKRHGIRTKITSYTHDFGADLILRYHGKKYVIQAKRWNDSVGIKAVQETIGAMSYYNAHYGAVITNSYFTKSAKELASASQVVLLGRYDLARMMDLSTRELMDFVSRKSISDTSQNSTYSSCCPYCGIPLVKRKGKYGSFYGCSNYPDCTFTKDNFV